MVKSSSPYFHKSLAPVGQPVISIRPYHGIRWHRAGFAVSIYLKFLFQAGIKNNDKIPVRNDQLISAYPNIIIDPARFSLFEQVPFPVLKNIGIISGDIRIGMIDDDPPPVIGDQVVIPIRIR